MCAVCVRESESVREQTESGVKGFWICAFINFKIFIFTS